MWPKAIAQLIELAPHAARLLPMADKFFQSKSSIDDSSKKALDAMAEGLRGDLGQVTAAHAGLYRQLNDQSAQLSSITTELRANRAAIESTEARITGLEKRLDKIAGLLIVVTLLALVAIGLTTVVLYHSNTLLHQAH